MKIANYIQSYSYQNKEEFYKAIKAIKDIDFDILVLPELSYLPEDIVKHFKSSCKADKSGNKFIDSFIDIDIFNEKDIETLKNESLELSRQICKVVVFGNKDKNGTIFSVFANALAEGGDTTFKYHIKHTQQGNNNKAKSVLEISNFKNFEFNYNLQAIKYKGKKIALTICYDSTYSLFSYAYNVINNGIDIIINCTGGCVLHSKWFRSNKIRSIENNCFTFLTMGINKEKEEKIKHDYSFGITPNGYELKPKKIYPVSLSTSVSTKYNESGAIYLYEDVDDETTQNDLQLSSKSSGSHGLLTIPFNKTTDKKFKQEFLKKNDIKIINIFGKDIYNPMKYLPELIKGEYGGYVLTVEYKDLTEMEFNTKLSDLLKSISVWNHVIVLLNSDIKKITYCRTPKEPNPQTYIESVSFNFDNTPTKIGGIRSDSELSIGNRIINYYEIVCHL